MHQPPVRLRKLHVVNSGMEQTIPVEPPGGVVLKVPEPSGLLGLTAGIMGLWSMARRRTG